MEIFLSMEWNNSPQTSASSQCASSITSSAERKAGISAGWGSSFWSAECKREQDATCDYHQEAERSSWLSNPFMLDIVGVSGSPGCGNPKFVRGARGKLNVQMRMMFPEVDDDLDWTLDGEVPVLFPAEQVMPSFLPWLPASLSPCPSLFPFLPLISFFQRQGLM